MNTQVLTTNMSPISTTAAALAEANKRASDLAEQFATQRTAILKNLTGELGFTSPEDFILAYNEANNVAGRKTTKPNGANGNRKPRTNISDDRRAQIVKFFKDGGSAPDAVTKYDISLATAQNIKKEAGMVNARS